MRTVSFFLTIYAVLLAAITVSNSFDSELMSLTCVSAAVLYLAAVSWRNPAVFQAPGKSYFRGLFWLGSTAALVSALQMTRENPSPDDSVRVGLIMGVLVGWLFICARGGQSLAQSLYANDQTPTWRAIRRRTVVGVMAAGAIVQLSTLFWAIGPGSAATGWHVILGKDPWITGAYNFATPIFFGPSITWIAAVFGPTGRAFYALGIFSAAALLLSLIFRKGSLEQVLGSRAFRPIAALQIFFCGYLVNDFCWGAEDLSTKRLLASLALFCWLAVILAGLYLARRIVSAKPNPFEMAMFVGLVTPFAMAQAPLVGLMLLADAPGLVFLDLGALLSAYGCFAALSGTKRVATKESTAAVAV